MISKRFATMKNKPGKNTRRCIYCGGSGCRTRTVSGWAHKRCLPSAPHLMPFGFAKPLHNFDSQPKEGK